MKKHFVTFLSPGTLMSETTTKPIDSWDIAKAVVMSKNIKERHNATPFAFYFSTRERGKQDLDSKETKSSNRYFLGGTVLTLAQVKKQMPKERILISNMEGNKWGRIVVNTNSWKVIQPLEEGDKVLKYP